MDCSFCDPINLDLRKFYENELFTAIYNLRPFVEGHSLVMPKRHVKSILELNKEERNGLISFLNRCIFVALKYSGAYQFDVVLQEGTIAGHSIGHTHFHILPRKVDDNIGVTKSEWFQEFNKQENNIRRNLTKEETERIVRRLRWIVKEHRIQIESF
jgi:diadenosine tetraphosphate (Ap4A) HIT family hydrolase